MLVYLYMKNVILVHGSPDSEEYYDAGIPSPSNSHWFPWLQKQCLVKEVLCQTPEFPKPYEPVYESYVKVFEQFKITDRTVLVGHSSGAGFLLRYFSEHPEMSPARIILVAPWLDPERELLTPMFEFEIDRHLADRTDVHLLISADDGAQMHTSRERIESALPSINIREFADKGHFTEGDIGKEFPELLELILS